MEHDLKSSLGRFVLNPVRRHPLGVIVASIVVGLACRAVEFHMTPKAAVDNLSVYFGCESLILLAPLVFSVALMSSFGVSRREVIAVPVQVLAGTWAAWPIAMVVGLGCGLLAVAVNPQGNLIWDLPSVVSVVAGVTTVGSLVLVFGFPLGTWLSVATLGVFAVEGGRTIRGARANDAR